MGMRNSGEQFNSQKETDVFVPALRRFFLVTRPIPEFFSNREIA